MTARGRELIVVELDDALVIRCSPEVEHERRVAIYDMLKDNDFALVEGIIKQLYGGSVCADSVGVRSGPLDQMAV